MERPAGILPIFPHYCTWPTPCSVGAKVPRSFHLWSSYSLYHRNSLFLLLKIPNWVIHSTYTHTTPINNLSEIVKSFGSNKDSCVGDFSTFFIWIALGVALPLVQLLGWSSLVLHRGESNPIQQQGCWLSKEKLSAIFRSAGSLELYNNHRTTHYRFWLLVHDTHPRTISRFSHRENAGNTFYGFDAVAILLLLHSPNMRRDPSERCSNSSSVA